MATTLTLLLLSNAAYAAQILTGRQGETLSATVSRTEPTLIQIAGHRVRSIFGAAGEFTVIPDNTSGSAYLKPITEKSAFSIFVSDEKGKTWNLLLSVVEGPAEIITIKEQGGSSQTITRKGHDLPREESIKQMLFSLMSNNNDDDEDSENVNDVVPLWKESMFVRTKVVRGNSLVGEKYRLTDMSNKPMIIDERELYRKDVVAISIDKPDLQPAETTDVYVISINHEVE